MKPLVLLTLSFAVLYLANKYARADGLEALTVTVDSRSGPWDPRVNASFAYGRNDQIYPAAVSVNPGQRIWIGNAAGQAMAGHDFAWNGPDGYTSDPSGPVNGRSITPGIYCPSKYTPNDWPTYLIALMGTFADSSGVIVGDPFVVGTGSLIKKVPDGAAQVLFGVNDDLYADNSGTYTLQVNVALVGQVIGNGVVAWGDNSAGQLEVPVGWTDVVAVSAGLDHSVALKGDGTVVAWGAGVGWGGVPPDGLSDVVHIAAAGGANNTFNLVLKSHGTVVGWGEWEALPPAGLSEVVAIGGNYWHGLAVKRDGSVVQWGIVPTMPDGLSGVVAVAGGGRYGGLSYSLALMWLTGIGAMELSRFWEQSPSRTGKGT